MSSGLADRNWNPRKRFRSSPFSSSARSGLPASSAAQTVIRSRLSEIGGARLFQILFEPLEASLGDDEIREDQFVFHGLRIARRIDRAGRMGNGGILKARTTWTSASAFL